MTALIQDPSLQNERNPFSNVTLERELGKARQGKARGWGLWGWREQEDRGSPLQEEARDGGGNKEGDGEKTRQGRVQRTRGDDDC